MYLPHVDLLYVLHVVLTVAFSYNFRLHYRYAHQEAPQAASASGVVKEPRSDVTDSSSVLISPPPSGHSRTSPAKSRTPQVRYMQKNLDVCFIKFSIVRTVC